MRYLFPRVDSFGRFCFSRRVVLYCIQQRANARDSPKEAYSMSSFKDLRIVDNFYQTSAFFPMPTVCISTLNDDGSLNIGSYSLCFPYYIAGKERYAMLLECRNTSNTCHNILRWGKCAINFIPDDRKYFKWAVKSDSF